MVPDIRTDTAPRQRRRRPLRLVLSVMTGVVALAVAASFGVSWEVGWKLTHPARVPVTATPATVGLPYHTIRFPSRTDHLMLHGWLVPANGPSDRIIIFAHGYRENRSATHPPLPVAKALHEAGFGVLLFDFRDEGNSPGSEVTVGWQEQRDLLGAVDYARQLGYRSIGLYGMSMGASTALEVTARDSAVAATVADSPFADLYTYLTAKMPVWTHLPNWPFTSEILWELKTFAGIDAHQVNPLSDLAHWQPRPLLLIAGTSDTTIPPANSEALFREVKQHPVDSLWIIPGAKHVGGIDVVPAEYLGRVVTFFETYLP